MAPSTTALITEVSPYTKSGVLRLTAMCEAVWRIDDQDIPGDVVECGVWRGGNIILTRRLCPHRVCWLYDTFSGMTIPEDIDTTRSGRKAMDSYLGRMKPGGKWSAVSVAEVTANLVETKTWDEKYLRFVVGPVEQTLLETRNLPEQIALLRLDTDWYASTKVELEVLYPRLVPGGYLIVDDYGHWLGARKAVDDYFGEDGPSMTMIDYSAMQIIKPC